MEIRVRYSKWQIWEKTNLGKRLEDHQPSWLLLQRQPHLRSSQSLWHLGELRQGREAWRPGCRPRTDWALRLGETCNKTARGWPPCSRARCSCSPACPRSRGTRQHRWLCRFGRRELQPVRKENSFILQTWHFFLQNIYELTIFLKVTHLRCVLWTTMAYLGNSIYEQSAKTAWYVEVHNATIHNVSFWET